MFIYHVCFYVKSQIDSSFSQNHTFVETKLTHQANVLLHEDGQNERTVMAAVQWRNDRVHAPINLNIDGQPMRINCEDKARSDYVKW